MDSDPFASVTPLLFLAGLPIGLGLIVAALLLGRRRAKRKPTVPAGRVELVKGPPYRHAPTCKDPGCDFDCGGEWLPSAPKGEP